jgi:hypothetical protein
MALAITPFTKQANVSGNHQQAWFTFCGPKLLFSMVTSNFKGVGDQDCHD